MQFSLSCYDTLRFSLSQFPERQRDGSSRLSRPLPHGDKRSGFFFRLPARIAAPTIAG
jgi:hypothetical protein